MKRIFALLLCLVLSFSLVACGGAEIDVNTDTEDSTEGLFTEDPTSESDSSATSDKNTNTGTQQPAAPSDQGPNLVMANDQIKNRVVIYDLDQYEKGDVLEDLEVWSVKTGHAAGLKYRENTVFGDVVLVGGSRSAMIEYPSKKVIWSTTNSGSNTHSVELLPGGNIIFANSSGNSLRLFYTSALLDGNTSLAQIYKDYTLTDAHGVLWDPEYDVLWALGSRELAAYKVAGVGASQTLKKIGNMGATLPIGKTGGHDLSPDYTDNRYLYVTVNSCVMRFDKEEGTFDTQFKNSNRLDESSVKGFSNNRNNNFFISVPTDGKTAAGTNFEGHSNAAWLTDTIYFCYMKTANMMYKQAIKSEHSGFYKVRAFVGQYQ